MFEKFECKFSSSDVKIDRIRKDAKQRLGERYSIFYVERRSSKNRVGHIWVKESIQRSRRRMIIATTQAIRQRKHQSCGALHRVRRLSSNPRESLNRVVAVDDAVAGHRTIKQPGHE